MKKIILLSALSALFLGAVSCARERTGDQEEPQMISISNESHLTQTAWADEETTGSGFTFTAKGDWTATVTETTDTRASDVSWLTLTLNDVETYGGAAGTHTLKITLGVNETGADRTAQIIVASGKHSVTIGVTHKGTVKTDEEITEVTILPKKVKAIKCTNIGGYDVYSYACNVDYSLFSYDAQGKLTKANVKHGYRFEQESELNNLPISYSWTENSLTIVFEDEDWGGDMVAELENGRIVRITGGEDNEEGTDDKFEYDEDGHLVKISEERYFETYTWKNSRIAKINIEGDYEIHTFEYGGQQLNNSNVDLFAAVNMDSWWGGELSGTDAIGKRNPLLPSKVVTSGHWGDDKNCTFEYERDAEGYITKITKLSEREYDSCIYEIFYEGEEVVVGSKPNLVDNPVVDILSRKISSITHVSGSGVSKSTSKTSFSYDGDDVSKIVYLIGSDEVTYNITRDANSLTIDIPEEDKTYVLDIANGRFSEYSSEYIAGQYWEDEAPHDIWCKATIALTYDANGYIAGISDERLFEPEKWGKDEGTSLTYTWEKGRISQITNPDSYYEPVETIYYEGALNNLNIDLFHFLTRRNKPSSYEVVIR